MIVITTGSVITNCRSGSSTSSPSRGVDPAVFDSSYVEYLRSARTCVQNCVNACRTWSAPYNGEQPTVESFSQDRQNVSTRHILADGNLTTGEKKDVVPQTQTEVDAGDVKNEMSHTSTTDFAAVVMSASDVNRPLSFTADDGINQTQEIPSSDEMPTAESVADDGEVLLAADSKLVPSSSNQDSAQPAVPPGRLSVVSASDDLESFFRQLSHMCKSDADDTAGDILMEFDEVISQLDASSEDFDSQKTITPEDQSASDFTENLETETADTVEAEPKLESTTIDGKDNARSLGDDVLRTEAQDGKILASAADNDNRVDKDDEDDVQQSSKVDPFSSLLQCKYEPPYLPTIGMSLSTAISAVARGCFRI